MGFRYRKSVKLPGGFRVNLSKSGVGYSWGTKGFRATKTARGNVRKTYSIPGTGLSYVEESKRKTTPKKKTREKEMSQMASRSANGQKKRRKWPYILVALLLIIVIGSAMGGNDSTPTDQSTASINTETSATTEGADTQQEEPFQAHISDSSTAPQATTEPQEEPQADSSDSTTTEPAEEPVVQAPAEPDPAPTQNAQTVYVTPTGKRYHYDPHCNDGTYIASTLEEALAAGLTPCKKCAGG